MAERKINIVVEVKSSDSGKYCAMKVIVRHADAAQKYHIYNAYKPTLLLH